MTRRLYLSAIALAACICAAAQEVVTFLPEPGKANGAAVVVCPGGSYYWLSKTVEGTEVGHALAEEGFAAFVLYYRTAGVPYFLFKDLAFRQHHYPDALDDLRRTIISVRSRAEEYGIDTSRVGVMGFSAGGHLVLDCGEEPVVEDGVSSLPSFIVPVYPVVTMSDDAIVHSRSRRALLGRRWKDPALRDRLSMERHAGPGMPPVFLVCCTDDPVVDWRNSLVMEEALSAAGVPHECHVFEKGGHGFGISSGDAPWFPMFLEWFGRL